MSNFTKLHRMIMIIFVILAFFLTYIRFGRAGVFDGDPETEQERLWFSKLTSCCGLGDAFVADYFETRDGKLFARITDGVDRYYNMETELPIGTEFEIPYEIQEKIKTFPPNPTGHGVIFLRAYIKDTPTGRKIIFEDSNYTDTTPEKAQVFCYFFPSEN